MKSKILFTAFAFIYFFINVTVAQNPLVKQWDKRLGGTDIDHLSAILQTTDGGFILAGYSVSGIGGDKTQANWDTVTGTSDFWIVKTDSAGNKQWDKDFGGTNNDKLLSIQQTTDGGYILGGSSSSGIGGDKTQPLQGFYDYWIVKMDSSGNKQWDKDFGGLSTDELVSIKQTADGGFFLGGYSYSGIGGDKTQPSWGDYDYWIIKTDSLGNKQWDKDFGGTDQDLLLSTEQTSDGGFILGGWSRSEIGGNKTQALRDTSTNSFLRGDYWIVKTDSLGNKQWDKDFGGMFIDELISIEQTVDGGFILAGHSVSGIGGDKTQALWGSNDYDFWIVKTDSAGNKQWDKDFGGTEFEDEFGNITQTSDGGYLISGTSYSNISGNKTEYNLGFEQTWVLKTDSLGNKQWDKTLHTNSVIHDEIGYAIQTADGCYLMANYTAGGIGGDKTQPNWDTSDLTEDYWLIKFCDSTLTTTSNFDLPISNFNLYPNPTNKFITVTYNLTVAKQTTVSLFNMYGQKLKTIYNGTQPAGAHELKTDMKNIANGIYYVKMNVDGREEVRKVVKTQ